MKVRDVLHILDKIAPFDTAEQWDNVGLMVGNENQEVRSILFALDPTLDTITFASDNFIDLVITHHPLIFNSMKKIDFLTPLGKKITSLIKANIALVSMHTNLDKARGGVTDILVKHLKLKDVSCQDLLRIGYVDKPGKLDAWVCTLGFKEVRIVDADKEVCKVGICAGSGMDLWQEAFHFGCDTFVTGDVTYHRALDAFESGLNIVDLGHAGTEEMVIKPFADMLAKKLPGVKMVTMENRPLFRSIIN